MPQVVALLRTACAADCTACSSLHNGASGLPLAAPIARVVDGHVRARGAPKAPGPGKPPAETGNLACQNSWRADGSPDSNGSMKCYLRSCSYSVRSTLRTFVCVWVRNMVPMPSLAIFSQQSTRLTLSPTTTRMSLRPMSIHVLRTSGKSISRFADSTDTNLKSFPQR